jgi:hypothetical protein
LTSTSWPTAWSTRSSIPMTPTADEFTAAETALRGLVRALLTGRDDDVLGGEAPLQAATAGLSRACALGPRARRCARAAGRARHSHCGARVPGARAFRRGAAAHPDS